MQLVDYKSGSNNFCLYPRNFHTIRSFPWECTTWPNILSISGTTACKCHTCRLHDNEIYMRHIILGTLKNTWQMSCILLQMVSWLEWEQRNDIVQLLLACKRRRCVRSGGSAATFLAWHRQVMMARHGGSAFPRHRPTASNSPLFTVLFPVSWRPSSNFRPSPLPAEYSAEQLTLSANIITRRYYLMTLFLILPKQLIVCLFLTKIVIPE